MILIASGAFITSEFQVEFGKLPPALLPLGNRRLYQHQVEVLRRTFPDTDIYLSLTDAYQLRPHDARLLEGLGVTLVSVPDGLTLGESLLFVINSVGRYDEPLRLLHGDTLIRDIPSDDDVIAVADVEDSYAWEVEYTDADGEKVWCGYFAFSDVKELARSLCAQRGRFVEAVRSYRNSRAQRAALARDWLDMGHVNTYFRSRAKVTTARAFNQLEIDDRVVRKRSVQRDKMRAEANWFVSIPPGLRRYTPQLISFDADEGRSGYEVEYLAQLPLNELFVHGSLPTMFWRRVFRLTNRLLQDFQCAIEVSPAQGRAIEEDFRALVVEKTDSRLAEYLASRGLGVDIRPRLNGREFPSLREIVAECQRAALEIPSRPGVSHGDLCFSNILYDSRLSALKVVDPRGLNARNELVVLGDLRYDVAKFVHSIVGLYDHVVAGLYELSESGPLDFQFRILSDEMTASIQRTFAADCELLGLTSRAVQPLVVLLFVSMLPLHADNALRQGAFLANALRLFADWKDGPQ